MCQGAWILVCRRPVFSTDRGEFQVVLPDHEVTLNAGAIITDVQAFRRALQQSAREQSLEEKERCLREALAHYRGAFLSEGEAHVEATVQSWILGVRKHLNNAGNMAHGLRQYTRALAYHQESLEIRERLQDRQGIAESYN